MKYILELAWRISEHVSMEKKHESVINSLKQIEGVFGISKEDDCPAPKFGTYETAIKSITRKLGAGLKGDILYAYRNKLKDYHLCDDRIWIEFNSKKVDFTYFSNYVVYEYIERLEPYRANIFPDELILLKDELIPFEIRARMNFRYNIRFFYPIQFFDTALIERAFGYGTKELYQKLDGKVHKVELIDDGLLIKGYDHYATPEECLAFNERMQKILEVKIPIGPLET